MGLSITYVHSHECERKGEEVESRPFSNAGVSWPQTPICEETLAELQRVKIEKY